MKLPSPKSVVGVLLCEMFQSLCSFLPGFHHWHVTSTTDFNQMCLWENCLYFARSVNRNQGIRIPMDNDHRDLQRRKQGSGIYSFSHCLKSANISSRLLPFHRSARKRL